MRVFPVVVLLLFCQPLLAEDTSKPDPFFKPVTLRLQGGSQGLTGYFENQIFNMKIWFKEYARQVDMDWAGLSPGEECLDDNWWLGISAQYDQQPEESAWYGQLPKEPVGVFLELHHRDKTIEARFYYPLAKHSDGHSYYPWLNIDRLRLWDINHHTQLYFTGSAGERRDTDWSLGLSYKFRSLELKATTSGDWSASLSTTTSVLDL